MMNKLQFGFAVLAAILLSACTNDDSSGDGGETVTASVAAPAPVLYNVINTYPHDTASFTQGLMYYKDVLYESTGSPDNISNNGSWVGPVDLKTGKQTKKVKLPVAEFGEGITILNDKVYQITWQNKKGYVYDLATFKKLKEFTYNHDGWGITHNGTALIVSDGSSNIYFWDPETLKETKRLSIQSDKGLQNNINELEFVDGFIYANIWQTDMIFKIDPATGNVVGKMDMSGLLQKFNQPAGPGTDVLNGIAYDSTTKRFFITGKKWPALFEVKLN